jgi:hypothetical protein
MSLRWLLAPLAGMIVLVVWGMIFWGLLAAPLGVFHRLPNDEDVTAQLLEGDATTGTYFMPWPRSTPEEFAAFEAQHKAGPFYRLSYVREGVDPSSPAKLALGCLHYFTVALLATGLLRLAAADRFAVRAAIIFVGGLLGTNLITLGDPIWFHLPWDYTRGVLVYEVIAWALLGVNLGAICPARQCVTTP